MLEKWYGPIQNCYYLSANERGLENDKMPDSTDLTPKDLSFFLSKSSYLNSALWDSKHPWDFENTWDIDESYNGGLPHLRIFRETGAGGGRVDFRNPYPQDHTPVSLGQTIKVTAVGATTWSVSQGEGTGRVVTLIPDPSYPSQARITGLSLGKAEIVATSRLGFKNASAYYVQDMANVQSYSFLGGSGAIAEGKNGTLEIPISVNPGADIGRIVWKSRDESVATVDSATRTVTAKVDLGHAIIEGTCTDPWGYPHTITYHIYIGRIIT
jgi:hypothetical protein